MCYYISTIYIYVAFLLVLGCLVKVNTQTSGQTIPALAEELGAKSFAKYVAEVGFDKTLYEPGPFTVFVPTDAAFDALPNDVVKQITNDKDVLKSVLLFHALSGEVKSSDFKNDHTATTLNWNMKVRINVYGETVTIDGSRVVSLNHKAVNGVIHLIDKVLYPLPQKNIVQFAASNTEFSTLTDAIIKANLIQFLSGGPFTFFAPTNKAFNNLPADVLKALQDENKVSEILKYHILRGTGYSLGLFNGKVLTVEGRPANIYLDSDGDMVNDANIIVADVQVSNGVVHVIDTVLIPPA